GSSPVAAVCRSPWRGRITKIGCVTGGAITTSNATITVATSPGGTGTFTAITGGTITVTFSSSSLGQVFTANFVGAPWTTNTSGSCFVNENDTIRFTPANASGANIPGYFFAEIVKA